MNKYWVLAAATVLVQLPSQAEAQRRRPPHQRGEGMTGFELRVERRGEGEAQLRGGELWLEAGQTVTLVVRPFDSSGRRLPEERSWFGLELDTGCDRYLEVERASATSFRIKPGRSHGSCEAEVWAANLPQFERELTLGYRGRSEAHYTAAESTEVAKRLYRALLGREGEANGVRGAAQQIERKGLEAQLDAMLASPEFRTRRSSTSPEQLLDGFYRGLFGRGVDAAGRREYTDAVAKGRHREVLLTLLRSPEFERSLR